MSNGNGNGSSGDPTPASSAIALLPGTPVVSLPSPGCFDFSPYLACGRPDAGLDLTSGRRSRRLRPRKEVDRGLLKRKAENPIAALAERSSCSRRQINDPAAHEQRPVGRRVRGILQF